MLYESGEDYLETILLLSEEHDFVRSVDVANRLGFSKPSITRAMDKLTQMGFVEKDENNHITLTEKGLEHAQSVYERHQVLRSFLHEKLGVSYENADLDACRIEHVISEETFQKIKEMLG